MSRRKDPADPSLFALRGHRRGRVERAVDAAVRSARAEKSLSELDIALITLARSQARAVDLAESARDVWAHARAGGELRETLIRLRLDPTSRGVGRDSIAEFLRSLTEPATVHPPGAAPVPDPPHV